MTDLVPCPLCGGIGGYYAEPVLAHPKDTRNRVGLHCGSCRKRVAVVSPDFPQATAWNEAGAYAEWLRIECGRLTELCRHVHDRLLRGDSDHELLTLLEEAWTMKTAKAESENG